MSPGFKVTGPSEPLAFTSTVGVVPPPTPPLMFITTESVALFVPSVHVMEIVVGVVVLG